MQVLIRFVYLDEPTLRGYAAQVDGGLIAETKVRLVKKGSAGGNISLKLVGLKGDRAGEHDQQWTMHYPPEAQFQTLLAIANTDPETIAWVDVVDPDSDFASIQVGETIAWECDVDIDDGSRLAARGGGGAQLMGLMGGLAALQAAGYRGGRPGTSGAQAIQPEQAALIQSQVQGVQKMLDTMNVHRVAVGTDSDTPWSIFGTLDSDHLRAEDISKERLIVVGKVKRIVGEGESRPLVNTEAMQLMSTLKPPGKAPRIDGSGEIRGPALELDILTVYR